MSQYNVGLAWLKVGDFNKATGAITNLVEVEVYKNTLAITETDGAETKHFQAGKSSPKKIHREAGEDTVAFQIMDTAAASLKNCLGGSTTAVNGRDTWHKAKGVQPEIIKALHGKSLDGTEFIIPRGSWKGKKNFNTDEGQIWLMDITVTPTDTGFAEIADFDILDPEAE